MYKSIKHLAIVVLLILLNSCGVTDTNTETSEKLLDDTYTSYSNWHISSLPISISDTWSVDPKDLLKNKGNIFWYNLEPSYVTEDEIYENISDPKAVQCLDFVYDPIENGLYNSNKSYENSDTSWAGVMTLLTNDDILKIAENFNTVYLEMWIKYQSDFALESFSIDLGEISEDINLNRVYDTEDRNFNFLLDENEDSGIDRLFDLEEPDNDKKIDPNNDNYSFEKSFNDYRKINFYENNNILDTEDINRNKRLDRVDNYYTYQVQLNPIKNEYNTESNDAGWIKYSIPLKSYNGTVGIPTVEKIETLRIWFNGKTDNFHIKIAELKFSIK